MNATDQNADHLRLLSIFHYVLAGVTALFGLLPLIHLGMGIFMLLQPEQMDNPPAFLGWLFIVLGGGFILFAQACAVCMLLAGRNLARRRAYRFVFVMACVECLMVPLGTVLGVFTLVILTKPEVKSLFTDGFRTA